MIKSLLFILSLSMLTSLNAQTFRAAKPKVLTSFNVESLGEQGQLAWYYPDRTPQLVEQFQKVEYGVKLPTAINDRIVSFLTQDDATGTLNPFNRHDVDITATFHKMIENGRSRQVKSVDAFFYEEFRRDLGNNKWRNDTTSFNFRIRFSPEEVGDYEVQISVAIDGAELAEMESTFKVMASEHKGFLEQGKNYKHLRYSKTKKSFTGVGQVIPWALYEDWYHTDKASGPVKFMPFYQAFNKLHSSGGNFTRFIAAPWFMQLEWEALGNYQPKMGQAWEFDRMNERCTELDIYYMFCGLLHSPLEALHEGKSSVVPGVSWESYCYNGADSTPAEVASEPKLNTIKPVDFYSDETANDHQKNYFRYLVSRWGFSTALAGWQLMSEADQTCEYRDYKLEDGTIKDCSENRAKVSAWTGNMVNFMREECDDVHPKSISIITGRNYSSHLWDKTMFEHENIEFFGLHDYIFEMDPPSKNIRNRNLVMRYETVTNLGAGLADGEVQHPEFHKKMFIYDEFGHVSTVPRKIPEDQHDDAVKAMNNCLDFNFKQDLWFTLSSGCAIVGLDWWNEHMPQRHAMWDKYFRGITKFSEDIDYEGVDYTTVRERKGFVYIAQRWPLTKKAIDRSNVKPYRKSDKVEAYIQVDSLGTQGFGWMSNRSFHWANLVDSIACLQPIVNGTKPFDKSYMLTPIDDDLVEKPIMIGEKEAFIKVYNVQRKATYTVDFYDTESGEVIETRSVRSRGGTLKIFAPKMKPSERYDVGFKFYDSERGWK